MHCWHRCSFIQFGEVVALICVFSVCDLQTAVIVFNFAAFAIRMVRAVVGRSFIGLQFVKFLVPLRFASVFQFAAHIL